MTDKRRPGTRRAAMYAAGLTPLVVLLTACGIQPTAVVDAGAPPSGFPVPGPEPVVDGPGKPGDVYFVSAGKLTPVSRPDVLDQARLENRDDIVVALVTLSLDELLTGPSGDEVAGGISSELLLQPSQKPVGVTQPAPTTVRLVMDMVTEELSPLAARQITCTVRAAVLAAGRPPDVGVLRQHDDGRAESLPTCPEDPGP